MLYDDSSENSSSSDEDDLDNLLVDLMFPPTFCPNYSRLNLEDISDVQCESMFRYKTFVFIYSVPKPYYRPT